MTERITLQPGDYTDMPTDPETRERIVEAFVAAGASRGHWDSCDECTTKGYDSMEWVDGVGVMGT